MDEHAAGQINALQQILESYVKVGDRGALLQLREHRMKLLQRTPSSGFLLIALRTQLLAELTLIEAALHKLEPPEGEPSQPELGESSEALKPDLMAAGILTAALASRAGIKSPAEYAEQFRKMAARLPSGESSSS